MSINKGSTLAVQAEDLEILPEKVRLTVQVSPILGYRWRSEGDTDDSPSPIVSRGKNESVSADEYVALLELGTHRIAITAEELVGLEMDYETDEDDAENTGEVESVN